MSVCLSVALVVISFQANPLIGQTEDIILWDVEASKPTLLAFIDLVEEELSVSMCPGVDELHPIGIHSYKHRPFPAFVHTALSR